MLWDYLEVLTIKNLTKLVLLASIVAQSQAQQAFTSLTYDKGYAFSGNLASLATTDGDMLTSIPDSMHARATVDITTNIGSQSFSNLTFIIDECINYPRMFYQFLAYDWGAQEWRGFHGNVAPNTLTREVRDINGPSLSRYVSAAKDVRIRVWWWQINDEDPTRDGWFSFIDYAALLVTP